MLFTIVTIPIDAKTHKFDSNFVNAELFDEIQVENYLKDINATAEELESFYDLKKNKNFFLTKLVFTSEDGDEQDIEYTYIFRHQ